MDKKTLDIVIKKIKVLHIKQGDILVMKIPTDITKNTHDGLRSILITTCRHYKEICKKDIFFVIISDDLDLTKIGVRQFKGR